MGPTVLFTHLKIILLQYFSVFSCIQTDPKCGELLSHTTPTKGKLVSVPILYVVEEDPTSRYISVTQKQQTPNPKPKPKAQETKNQATWRKIDRTTTSMDEEPNGGESVGMKRRHKENDEDDSAEISGAYKRQKPLRMALIYP